VARVVTVGAGEDVQTVAARSGVSAAQLQQWNGGVEIKAGAKLIVPPTSVKLAGKTYDRGRGAGTAPATGLRVVTAKGGETVAQLAAQYNASVEEVAKLNGVAAGAQLARGQQLRVPTSTTDQPAPNNTQRRRR
jgi:LysM repeat protein